MKPKVMTPDEAVARIASGTTVAVGSLSAEPVALTAALWRRAGELRDVTILAGLMLTGYPFLRPEMAGAFRLRTWFMPATLIGGATREIAAEYLPLSWAQTARYVAEVPADVALLQLSPADRDGYHSLGISVSLCRPMLEAARLVVAEVNDAMPRTFGEALVHESEIDIAVPASHPLPGFPHREGDDVDRRIGRFAAELIDSGSTLQFGIGTIPGATVRSLIDLRRRELRLTSQLTDAARALMDAGACVDGAPKAIVGEILGTTDLYAWCHENRSIEMVGAERSHSIRALSGREKFVSINSALEVDLYGQVNSEWLDGKQSGGIGGSLDFAVGAQIDRGLSIVALRAATAQGASRIVPALQAGPVTVPRALVQVVVTEHGVADLRNRTSRERALALAGIADPTHRAALKQAAGHL